MLRESTQTLPMTILNLGPIDDGAILNKTSGSVVVQTRLKIMRYINQRCGDLSTTAFED